MRILIIEDSLRLLRALSHGLGRLGYSVDTISNGKDGYDYARLGTYDAIILDLMLPGMDGWALLEQLRAQGNDTHILILSARDSVEDRVRGLRLGADDYLVKPFAFEELRERLAALVRRKYASKTPVLRFGELEIDTSARLAKIAGETVSLTPGEFAILECLALNKNQVLTKEQIMDSVQSSDAFTGTNVIEVMICHLRKKLGPVSRRLKTRRGFGYVFDGCSETSATQASRG